MQNNIANINPSSKTVTEKNHKVNYIFNISDNIYLS